VNLFECQVEIWEHENITLVLVEVGIHYTSFKLQQGGSNLLCYPVIEYYYVDCKFMLRIRLLVPICNSQQIYFMARLYWSPSKRWDSLRDYVMEKGIYFSALRIMKRKESRWVGMCVCVWEQAISFWLLGWLREL